MKQSPLRVTACFFLGFLAGISFIGSVLPFFLSLALQIPSLVTLVEVDRYTVPLACVWAVCGGLLAWLGGARAGMLVLGACGLGSGVFLGLATLDTAPASVVVVSGLAGLAYGSGGGALLGKIFPRVAKRG
ncbi:MAG: hypothetical protein HY900_11310 [Deltaproteobacteria bacterium]|nr:hypothetical protein [Deltaproteobacteria bacterium]